jgi:glycosyltransferase involved in cell wall biosynthesis
MKILVLDEEFPYPANNGKRTRSFNLYRRLAGQFKIRYIGYGNNDSVSEQALRAEGIEPFPVYTRLWPKRGWEFYIRLLANLASPLPYMAASQYTNAYQAAVQKSLADFRPDLLLCEWTPYAIYVRDIGSIRKMISAHNVEADIWQRYYENECNSPRRWYIREQWRKVERFEGQALRGVDGTVAVSHLDRARLANKCPGLKLATIENGVDLEYFHSLSQPMERRNLVFTGSMDWRPNQDAARYFVKEIFPLLRQARHDVECTFVGRNPPTDIKSLAKTPGIHITGTVDDVRPHVARAPVYVVPLRIGGGSRLKILEALAMRRAIVSTSIGAEGLEVVPNKHLLVADEPSSFAASVLRLLGDPNMCANLAAEGRRLVEEVYGWDALAERFAKFIYEVVRGDRYRGSRRCPEIL